MKKNIILSRRPFRVLNTAALLAALLPVLVLPSAWAGGNNENPRVIPHTPGTAKTYSDLSIAWRNWQHGVIDETGLSPFDDDPNGDLGNVAQSGSVHFLAGAPADQNAVRTCTIPTGKFIHFPIINAAWITDNPGGAAQISDPDFFEFVDGLLYGVMTDDAVTLGVTVDGQELANLHDYFVESPIFELPYYGSLDDGYLNFDYGYYILLAPLSAGEHTIHISGSFPFFANTIEVDVTYELTVVGD